MKVFISLQEHYSSQSETEIELCSFLEIVGEQLRQILDIVSDIQKIDCRENYMKSFQMSHQSRPFDPVLYFPIGKQFLTACAS